MIQFRCIRCHHPLQSSEELIGKKMYCPVCYLELTIPTESTIKPVDESQLYTADEQPLDVRTMEDRKRIVSFPCSVCHTNIAVTKEQIGTEIICPECETKINIPLTFAPKFDRASKENSYKNSSASLENVRETYGLHSNIVSTNRDKKTGTDSDMIRIYCKLCGTMMYAFDNQIGTELICPDCETKNIVPQRPKQVPLPPPLPTLFEGAAVFGITENSVPKKSPSGLLIPVVCSLCGTRMYAQESEIGGFKICPDCGRQNEIKAVPKSQWISPVVVSGNGYDVETIQTPPVRPTFRTLTDYRTVEGSLDKELYDTKKPELRLLPNLSILPKADNSDRSSSSTEETEASEKERFRRAMKKAGFNPDSVSNSAQLYGRTPLPKYPFWTRIFVPFINARLWRNIIAVFFLCVTGILMLSMLSGIWIALAAPFVFVLELLGLSLLANTAHSMFLWTTSGNDLPEQDDWQEYRFLESGAFALWLLLLVLLAASPGYLLSSYFPTPPSLPESPPSVFETLLLPFFTELIPLILFFPIFFLSCMESGSYFSVLAKETCRSLLTCTKIWLYFYLISLFLVFLFGLLFVLISILVQQYFITGLTLIIFPIIFFTILYARFLGRLGWTLEEAGRSENIRSPQ